MKAKKASVLLTLLMTTSLMYGQKNTIEDDLYFQPEDRATIAEKAQKAKKEKTETVYITRQEFEDKYSTANEEDIDEYNRRGKSQQTINSEREVFGNDESTNKNVKYVIVDEEEYPQTTSINIYSSPWSMSWSGFGFSVGLGSPFWWSPYYSSWAPNYPYYGNWWGWNNPYYSWNYYPGPHSGWYDGWCNPWWDHHYHGGGYYPPYYGWNDHYYHPSYESGRTYSRNGNRTGSGHYNNDRYAYGSGGSGSLGGASRYPDRNTSANSGRFNPSSRFPSVGNGNVSVGTRPENNGQSTPIGSSRTSRTRVSSSANNQISSGTSNKSNVITAPSRTSRGSSSSQHIINSTGRTRSSDNTISRSSSSNNSSFGTSRSSSNSSSSSSGRSNSSYSSGSSYSGSSNSGGGYSGGRSSGGNSGGSSGGASRGSRSR